VELKKLHERLATTAVYVTHDQVEAMTMGDRIVVMKDGLIQQVGSPLELYNEPINRFVGGFIGSPAMNFLEAELNASNDIFTFAAAGFQIDLPPERTPSINAYGKKRAVVGIRPEDFRLTSEHIPGKTILADVDVVEPIGNETYVNAIAADLPLIAAVGRKSRVDPHSTVILIPNPEKIHLFDIQSEVSVF
jgi:multiple sugar transport system ATP-binding protein